MGKIPFLVSLVVIIIFILISRKETYLKEQENILKEDYSLREIIYMGLYIIDLVGVEKFKKTSADAYGKIASMYALEADSQFRYYIANKLVLCIVTFPIVNMFQASEASISIPLTILSLVAPIIVYFLADSMINEKFEKRSQKIKYEVPEFLSKVTLMINAGLTFENALARVIETSDLKHPLYHELKKTTNDMQANIPRDKCLADFSRRCKISEITKFTTIVLQNINKGTTDLCDALNLLAGECWDGRKFLARKKGEEASSKLLFPMMIMLIAIFILVLVPAFLGLMSEL